MIFFKYCVIVIRTLNTRSTLLTHLWMYDIVDLRFNVVQESSSTYFSCLTEILCLLNSNSSSCPAFGPWQYHSNLWFYEFGYFRYLTKVESCTICLSLAAYFTWHNVLKVHPCCGILQNFLFIKLIFHCMYIPHFLYPLICWWTFSLFLHISYRQ